MKNAYVFFFLVSSFFSFAQTEYEFKGYYIKFGNVINQTDSIIEYRVGNIIFQPNKKLKKCDVVKIKNRFKAKKDFLKFLNRKGLLYYLIPKINNVETLQKHYDSLRVNKTLDKKYKNSDCITFLPDNLIDYLEIERIEFNGLKQTFENSKLLEIFPLLKNNDLPVIIEVKEYLSNPNKEIVEKKSKKKVFFDFTLQGVNCMDNILTIMVFDCK